MDDYCIEEQLNILRENYHMCLQINHDFYYWELFASLIRQAVKIGFVSLLKC